MHWTVSEVASCPSTNVELVRRAKAGSALPPYLLIADQQTEGIGRDGRKWITPGSGAITMSALVDPKVSAERLGLTPLFTAVVVAEALRVHGFAARVKWPNDILLPAATPVEGFGNYRKVGGILVQSVAGVGVVIGIGVNVTQTEAQLPVPSATSLALNGPAPELAALRTEIADRLLAMIRQWEDGGEAALREEFRRTCISIGSQVEIDADTQNDRPTVLASGIATDITDDGAILIEAPDGATHVVHAADVWLRTAG